MKAILSADSARLLETLFGYRWDEAWVCWKSNMHGKRVCDLKEGDLPEDEDCYFSIALMREGAPGRRASWASLVMAIVFDDVGTKIDKDGFDMFCPFEPTWVIETSPGNFQYGFAVKRGEAHGISKEEYKAARAKMATHPIWGKSDAAMDPVHLYRLPQGTNTKHGWRVS